MRNPRNPNGKHEDLTKREEYASEVTYVSERNRLNSVELG